MAETKLAFAVGWGGAACQKLPPLVTTTNAWRECHQVLYMAGEGHEVMGGHLGPGFLLNSSLCARYHS